LLLIEFWQTRLQSNILATRINIATLTGLIDLFPGDRLNEARHFTRWPLTYPWKRRPSKWPFFNKLLDLGCNG